MTPALCAFYTLMVSVVAGMHDHALREEGESRPIASAVVGLLWPLILLLLFVGLLAMANGVWRDRH